jgi:hypothetical protein
MASTVVVNVDLGALPSPEKKTRRTSHQVQVERENKKKRASVNDLATSRATTLLSEERKKPKSEQRSAKMICDHVENKFKARKTKITLSTNTINRYVREGDIGVGAKRRGYEGILSKEAFHYLVLAFESYIQINQVNTTTFSNKQLMITVNKVCNISSEKRIGNNVAETSQRYKCIFQRLNCQVSRETSSMDNLRQSQSLVRRMGEICYQVRFWHLDKRQQGQLHIRTTTTHRQYR